MFITTALVTTLSVVCLLKISMKLEISMLYLTTSFCYALLVEKYVIRDKS